jgi:hypothetical protein
MLWQTGAPVAWMPDTDIAENRRRWPQGWSKK